MKDNFEKSLEWVLIHEGGYVNHPRDPGGATNRGVTQKTYDAWRAYKGLLRKSVEHITDSEVREIYYQHYWVPVGGNELPAGVDYEAFDFAVNSGVSRSSRFHQSVVGVKQDGVIGPQSLQAIKSFGSENVIVAVCNRRMAFLRRLKHWPTFGKGWSNRVMGHVDGIQLDDIGVIDRAVKMARGENPTAPPGPVKGKGIGRPSIWRWLKGWF